MGGGKKCLYLERGEKQWERKKAKKICEEKSAEFHKKQEPHLGETERERSGRDSEENDKTKWREIWEEKKGRKKEKKGKKKKR